MQKEQSRQEGEGMRAAFPGALPALGSSTQAVTKPCKAALAPTAGARQLSQPWVWGGPQFPLAVTPWHAPMPPQPAFPRTEPWSAQPQLQIDHIAGPSIPTAPTTTCPAWHSVTSWASLLYLEAPRAWPGFGGCRGMLLPGCSVQHLGAHLPVEAGAVLLGDALEVSHKHPALDLPMGALHTGVQQVNLDLVTFIYQRCSHHHGQPPPAGMLPKCSSRPTSPWGGGMFPSPPDQERGWGHWPSCSPPPMAQCLLGGL